MICPKRAPAGPRLGRTLVGEQPSSRQLLRSFTLEVVLLITIEHFLETGELYYILPGISVFPLRYPPGECLV